MASQSIDRHRTIVAVAAQPLIRYVANLQHLYMNRLTSDVGDYLGGVGSDNKCRRISMHALVYARDWCFELFLDLLSSAEEYRVSPQIVVFDPGDRL